MPYWEHSRFRKAGEGVPAQMTSQVTTWPWGSRREWRKRRRAASWQGGHEEALTLGDGLGQVRQE